MPGATGKDQQITYAELSRRAKAGRLTDREIGTYFKIDERPGRRSGRWLRSSARM